MAKYQGKRPQAQAQAPVDAAGSELITEPVEPTALVAMQTAEINQQIATAKRFPRDIKKFVVESSSLACMSEEVAGECFYRLERKDKDGNIKVIEGPSSRFAEIVASTWGNCRAAARTVGEDDKFVTAQGAFIDLERNVAITYESRRRITTSSGHRYGDDMVAMTANGACSIALRNAVLKGVPKAFWIQAYEQAVKTFRGTEKTLIERRTKMIDYFKKLGVPLDRVLATIGKPNIEAVDLDDLVRLKGFATAIKEGDQTIDQVFPPPKPEQPTAPTLEDVGITEPQQQGETQTEQPHERQPGEEG